MGLDLKVIRYEDPSDEVQARWGYSQFAGFQRGVAAVCGAEAIALLPLINHSWSDGTLTRDECESVLGALWRVKAHEFSRVEVEKRRPYEAFWADLLDFVDLLEVVVRDEDAHGLAFM